MTLSTTFNNLTLLAVHFSFRQIKKMGLRKAKECALPPIVNGEIEM
jgi:hypothetical protein